MSFGRAERAKRIVVRGRKVFNNAALWKNKKKDTLTEENISDDDNQYLYYSDEDNY